MKPPAASLYVLAALALAFFTLLSSFGGPGCPLCGDTPEGLRHMSTYRTETGEARSRVTGHIGSCSASIVAGLRGHPGPERGRAKEAASSAVRVLRDRSRCRDVSRCCAFSLVRQPAGLGYVPS